MKKRIISLLLAAAMTFSLDECVTEYHDEDPDFYDGRVKFFEENDQ